MQGSTRERIRNRVRHAARVAGQVLYGMSVYGWVREVRQQRGAVERLFVLVAFGDIVGVPILPSYYTLRLLPHFIPFINQWKRSLLRERDWSDLSELIEGID